FGGGAAWEPEPGTDAAGPDSARVDSLIATLSTLKTPRYTQYEGPFPDASGLAAPAFSVEVQLTGGSGTRQLRVGRPTPLGGDRFATAEVGPAGSAFLLPASAWEAWI